MFRVPSEKAEDLATRSFSRHSVFAQGASTLFIVLGGAEMLLSGKEPECVPTLICARMVALRSLRRASLPKSMENEKSPQRLYVWENIPSLFHVRADKVPLSDSGWPSLPHLTRGPGDLLRDLDNQARFRPGWWHCSFQKPLCNSGVERGGCSLGQPSTSAGEWFRSKGREK